MTDNKKITGDDSASHHDGIEVDDTMMEAVYLASPDGSGRSTGDGGGGGGDKDVDSDVDALLAELSMSGNEEEEQQQLQGANATNAAAAATKNNPSSPSGETDDEAFNKLRESTTHLTSAIHAATADFDSKLGLSKSVRNLDSNYRVSESFTSSISKLGSWWNTVDEQYQIGSKTKEVTNVISEKVGQTWSDVERSVSPKLSRQPPPDATNAAAATTIATTSAARDTANVDSDDETAPLCNASASAGGGGGVDIRKWNETIQRTNENIKKLDEEHKITKTTVETLARGAEFLAQSIRAAVSSSRDDGDDVDDNDGDPNSFPCSPKRSVRGVRDEDDERVAGDGKGNDDVNFGFVVNKWVEDHSHNEQKQQQQEKKA